MKVFATVFLVLFASAAVTSGESFEDFPKLDLVKPVLIPINLTPENFGLIEWAQEFIQQESDRANQFIKKFNQLSEDVKIESQSIAKDAKHNIEALFENIHNKIINLKNMGGIYKRCAEKLENKLKEIKTKGVDNVVQCVKGVAGALKEFALDVSKEVTELTKNIAQLVLTVKECIDKNGNIATAKCAFQKIKEVKELIPKIVSGIKSTVETVSNKASQVLAAGRSCKDGYMNSVKVAFDDHHGEVNKCYDVVQKFIMYRYD